MLRTLAAAVALAASPSTVATVPGQVTGVAQGGGTIALLASGPSDCKLTVGSRVAATYPACTTLPQDLAVANGKAAWGGYADVRCSETTAEVHAPGFDRTFPGDCRGFGTTFQGLAGDGASFYYSLLQTKEPPASTRCGEGGSCRWKLAGGEVDRIAGTHVQRVGAVPGAVLIAGAQGLLALVQPASAAASNGRDFDWPRAATNGKVVIWDTKAGRAVASFAPAGIVRAVALSPTRAVVLVQQGKAFRLEWHDAQTGARLGAVPALAATAHLLATDGRVVAYAVGKQIRVLDLAHVSARTVATAAGTPSALSIDGGRLAWADNTASRGRVLSTPVG